MYTSTDEAGLIIPFGVCGARRAALLHRKDPLKHKSVTVLTSRKYSHHNRGQNDAFARFRHISGICD